MTISKKLYLYLILSMIFTSGCYNQPDYHTDQPTQVETVASGRLGQKNAPDRRERRTVTIWVHGTLGLSRTVMPRFFRSIAGMRHVDSYNRHNNLYEVAHALNDAAPNDYPFEDLYLFGWSGELNAEARRIAAAQLLEAIKELVAHYTQLDGQPPLLRIITHSHGGNVALYLAQLQKGMKNPLVIDILILLACPVQEKTVQLLSSYLFKQIIALYSKLDVIQVADPQGLYELKNILTGKKRAEETPLFSRREFPAQDNLIQQEISFGWKPGAHAQFILRDFVITLPAFLKKLQKSRR